MAKRSRRARRQASGRQRQNVVDTTVVEAVPVGEVSDAAVSKATVETSLPVKRKTIDFAKEYGYVYKELRNVVIIAVLMFVVMIGLSFVI
jgi:hypothetical protein